MPEQMKLRTNNTLETFLMTASVHCTVIFSAVECLSGGEDIALTKPSNCALRLRVWPVQGLGALQTG